MNQKRILIRRFIKISLPLVFARDLNFLLQKYAANFVRKVVGKETEVKADVKRMVSSLSRCTTIRTILITHFGQEGGHPASKESLHYP